ncbi:hypothetical protein M1271_05145 [Patescibacteria group bacterium]|nr:hypothetical protein [Patescibacteria group bacterium]MCL5797917.1 hypothetical protein [Patescibacteria group bacterium]
MKKLVSVISLFGIVFILSVMLNGSVLADWWQRPEARPTSPAIERTVTVPPLPTNPPQGQPTPTQGGGGSNVTPSGPTATPAPSTGSSSTEDPCAPGKSYYGPYCGWSPSVSQSSGGGGGGGTSTGARIGGPQVLGLSYTSGPELSISDIILLAGVLCLLLYVRSKVEINVPRSR